MPRLPHVHQWWTLLRLPCMRPPHLQDLALNFHPGGECPAGADITAAGTDLDPDLALCEEGGHDHRAQFSCRRHLACGRRLRQFLRLRLWFLTDHVTVLLGFFILCSMLRIQLHFLHMVATICHHKLDHGSLWRLFIQHLEPSHTVWVLTKVGKFLTLWMLAFTHPIGFCHQMALALI